MNSTKILVAMVAGAALVVACASAPKTLPEVEQARADVQKLEGNPAVNQAASKELSDARASLGAADTALKEKRVDDAMHYAYLASHQAQTGEQRIEEKRARDAVAQGEAERNRVLLEARSQQAESAAAAARAQAAEAEAARQEAQSMQRQLSELQAKQTERGMVLTLGDVLFDTGQSTLKPGANAVMDRVAQFMQRNPETRVMIEGHTDSRGSEEYNMQLAQRRAQAVQQELSARNVDASRIQAVGKGEGFPVASNDTAAGRQQNRRVDIVFSDSQGRFAGDSNAVRR